LRATWAIYLRPSLRMMPEEPDQVKRLIQFRREHPDVIIGAAEFGIWEARIPQRNGETVAIRHTLQDLLDRLEELTGRRPAGERRRSPQRPPRISGRGRGLGGLDGLDRVTVDIVAGPG
jgi:hypothetical protein